MFDLQSQPYGDFSAFWEDLKFEVRHVRDLDRVAIVGERRWEKVAVKVFDRLASVPCCCFAHGQEDLAWARVESGDGVERAR